MLEFIKRIIVFVFGKVLVQWFRVKFCLNWGDLPYEHQNVQKLLHWYDGHVLWLISGIQFFLYPISVSLGNFWRHTLDLSHYIYRYTSYIISYFWNLQPNHTKNLWAGYLHYHLFNFSLLCRCFSDHGFWHHSPCSELVAFFIVFCSCVRFDPIRKNAFSLYHQ